MRVPLVLRFPELPGAENGELREPRRYAGIEAQMPAELLRQRAINRRMQKDRERSLVVEMSARTGFDRVDQCLLFAREIVERKRRQPRWRLFGWRFRPCARRNLFLLCGHVDSRKKCGRGRSSAICVQCRVNVAEETKSSSPAARERGACVAWGRGWRKQIMRAPRGTIYRTRRGGGLLRVAGAVTLAMNAPRILMAD